MISKRALKTVCLIFTLAAAIPLRAASSDVADAVMRNRKDTLRTLLQQKADVNIAQIDGTTALHWAVRADDLETTDLLLRAGAKATVANRDGATPMQLAALNGNAAIIDRLLKAGVDVNAPLSSDGDTALMLAARTGKPDAVKVLLGRRSEDRCAGKLGQYDRSDVGRRRRQSCRGSNAH
jgi:ankyrin repeat protein